MARRTTPSGNRTAHEGIVTVLRGRILAGELTPGTPLRQNEVAADLEVSTTPVREALRQLVVEGLVDADPHRGMSVHVPSLAEFHEIYQIMKPLEEMAIRAATNKISDQELRAAVAHLDAMDAAQETAEWVQLNVEFHDLLLAASRLPVLASTLRRLRNLSALYVAHFVGGLPTRIRHASEEHRELVDALRARDEEKAVRIAVTHLLAATRTEYLEDRSQLPSGTTKP